jgi:hypothetical protein
MLVKRLGAPAARTVACGENSASNDAFGFQTWVAADLGFWNWFGRRAPREDQRLREWKRDWNAAVMTPVSTSVEVLRARLDALGLAEDDAEIEREMLEGLEDAVALSAEIERSGLPSVDTGHRVIGHERCHFTAPAAMPDEPGQPTGRLLLTSGRAIFLGGAGAVSSAWHRIGEVRHADRDFLLVRTSRDRLYRFQCNSFSDALRATLIAKELIRSVRL